MSNSKKTGKTIGIIFYSIAWACVECLVFFIVPIMPPPWKVFHRNNSTSNNSSSSGYSRSRGSSEKKSYRSDDDHNWDKDFTDQEYYDIVDDD